MIARLVAGVGAIGCIAVCHGSPTGLSLIPIADILRHREVTVNAGLSGVERNVSRGYSFCQSTTIGLADRIELGYASDLLGHVTYDVKAQLFDSGGIALSGGVQGCSGAYREPYLVARYDFRRFRLHGGYWNTAGKGRWFAGVDFPISESVCGSLETLGGKNGQSWASFSWAIPGVEGLSLNLGFGVPYSRRDGVQHQAGLTYAFRF